MKLNPLLVIFGVLAFAGSKKGSSAVPSLRMPKDGQRFTIEELRALAAQLGFPDPNVAAAVAMAESTGSPEAIGDNGQSVGLWQIHMPSHPEYDAGQLRDPTYNGRAALAISSGGTDWHWWTQFRNGKYKKFMPAPIAGDDRPAAQLEPPPAAAPTTFEAPLVQDASVIDEVPAPLHVEVVEPDDDDETAEPNGSDTRVRISESPAGKRGRRPRA